MSFERFDEKIRSGSDASEQSVRRYSHGNVFLRAIKEGQQVEMKYGSNTSKRTIEVRKLLKWDGKVYIYAYCHRRKENRTFRMGRVNASSLGGDNKVVSVAGYNPPEKRTLKTKYVPSTSSPTPRSRPSHSSPEKFKKPDNSRLPSKPSPSTDGDVGWAGWFWGIIILFLLIRGCSG